MLKIEFEIKMIFFAKSFSGFLVQKGFRMSFLSCHSAAIDQSRVPLISQNGYMVIWQSNYQSHKCLGESFIVSPFPHCAGGVSFLTQILKRGRIRKKLVPEWT